MAQQTINNGSAPNDGTGDKVRDAMTKINANFTELYGRYRVPPTSATSSGIAGQFAADTSYFYFCVAANTWRRVALTTW